jgi:hypothetical protein
VSVELMDAIGGANATSSSLGRLIAQEDAALVAGAKTGDAHAFELLVERHEGKIFSMAQRMTRNREDAEDVVQQSFQKEFIHLKKFEGESLFQPNPKGSGSTVPPSSRSDSLQSGFTASNYLHFPERQLCQEFRFFAELTIEDSTIQQGRFRSTL